MSSPHLLAMRRAAGRGGILFSSLGFSFCLACVFSHVFFAKRNAFFASQKHGLRISAQVFRICLDWPKLKRYINWQWIIDVKMYP